MSESAKVRLISLTLDKNGLILKFEDSNKVIFTFTFEDPCPFRVIDESYRLGLWDKMSKNDSSRACSTWVVRNSDFVEFLNENGEWSHFNPDSKHYLFIAGDDVIDVVGWKPPVVATEE